MTITAEQTINSEVAPEVATAYQAYCRAEQMPAGWGLLFAIAHLDNVAQAADQPLCQWGCHTPHNVTVRKCCGDACCDIHEEDHDDLCTSYLAILREDRF